MFYSLQWFGWCPEECLKSRRKCSDADFNPSEIWMRVLLERAHLRSTVRVHTPQASACEGGLWQSSDSTMPDIHAGLQTMKLLFSSAHLWPPRRHTETRVPETSPTPLTVVTPQNHVNQIIVFYRAPICLLHTVSGARLFYSWLNDAVMRSGNF